MAASIMQVLDVTIANVALPHMQTSLSATFDTITWVLTSYIIATAVAIPITGWLADQIGHRNLFLWSVGGFILTSMACGAATNLPEMVAFRFLQGVSAAFIGPLSQAALLDINPPKKHAKAMTIWGMGVMIGPILGPILGGWLTENANWRWVFYVNVPVGIITFGLLWALLPTKQTLRRKFDLFGFTTLALGLVSFQLMLDRGGHQDWFESTEIWIEGALSIAFLWMFTIHTFSAKNALFDRELLSDRNLVTSVIFMALMGLMLYTNMSLLPPLLQHLLGYPVLDTGTILAMRGIGIMISMGLTGPLIGRVDNRILIASGLAITAVSLWQMANWSIDMGRMPLITTGLLQGFSFGLVFIPLNTIAFSTLAPHHRTNASSLLNLSRNVAASAGISIFTALLSRNTQISHSDLASHITDTSRFVNPNVIERFGASGEAVLKMLDLEINRQASMIAYLNDFWAMMWLTLLTIPLVFLIRPNRPKTQAVYTESK
jgi:DHA2 family multidrug resistance protein